jgi:RNA recognition motif-containing protein
MNKKLYVGNLNYNTTESKIAELFKEVGEVMSTNLIIDRYSGRSKGFAFVDMAEQSAAQEALNQLNGKEADGRTIKVAEARPKRSRRSDSYSGGRYGRYYSRRLYIGRRYRLATTRVSLVGCSRGWRAAVR